MLTVTKNRSTPETASRENTPAKNALWEIFADSTYSTTIFADQPQYSCRENHTYAYEPAPGVHYYGYRYYSPTTGRWITRDPIEEHAFLMRYIYKLLYKYIAEVNGKVINELEYEVHMQFDQLPLDHLNEPVYAFVMNSPASKLDLLGLKSTKDKWKEVVDKIAQSKDMAKEIADALKKGKASGATPKAVLSKLFGISKLTDDMVNVLVAFPDTQACLDMLKAKLNGNIVDCGQKGYECALLIGAKSNSAATALILEKLFDDKICVEKKKCKTTEKKTK